MKYTEEELIEEIHKISKEYCNGNTPRTSDLKKYSNISYNQYYQHFGNWSNAIEKSKLKSYEPYKKDNQATEKELFQELEYISKEYCDGKIPKSSDVVKYSSIPIYEYKKRYGSWRDVIKRSHFDIKEYNPYNKVKKEKILEELKEACEKHSNNNSINRKIIEEKCSFSVKTCSNKFGSWKKAVDKAGLSISNNSSSNRKYSDEFILEEIRDVSEKNFNNMVIYPREFYKYSKVSESAVNNHFDSFSSALKCGGFLPNPDLDMNEISKNKSERNKKEIYRDISNVCDYDCLKVYNMNGEKYDTLGKSSLSYIQKISTWNEIKRETINWIKQKISYKPNYYGPIFDKNRKEIIKRDHGKCRVCNSKRCNVHAHHIRPVKDWSIEEQEAIHSPMNLIILCPSCHKKLEGKFKSVYHKEFEELAKDYLDIDEKEEKQSIFDY
jgi:5-methylcytosine-specific restriction endonuclease McrA